MAPTVVGRGVVTSALAAITPPFPVGYTPVANDIDLIIAECEGVTAPGAYTVPTGWAHVGPDGGLSSPVVQGTDTRLWVLWKRLVGSETAPSLGDSGDHNIGAHMVIRGCPTTGNPWNVGSVTSEAVSDTSAAWPTLTTTVTNTLVLLIASTSADIGTAQISAITGTHTLTSVSEEIDGATTSGNGGVIICYSGVQSAAGNIGNPTATLVTPGFKAFMTMAMANAPVLPSSPIQPRRTRNHPSFRR